MRYEPYLQRRHFSKIQSYSDKEAMALFAKEFPLEKPDNKPEYQNYSPKMKRLLTEIEQSLEGGLDFKRKRLIMKPEQVSKVRLRAGDMVENRDNYFKAKELNDPSPLEKYVDGEIKAELENKEGVKEMMQRQGYLDDYRVDHMTDAEYKEYVEQWADPRNEAKRT